jgi:UDP-N-acetyl-D-mannosaminuronate dehydrogenase
LAHDPLLNFWPELDRSLPPQLPQPRDVDAVVFTVAHQAYTELDVVSWLASARPVILDTNHVLTSAQVAAVRGAGHDLHFVGKGD